jgi:hypothetical protein
MLGSHRYRFLLGMGVIIASITLVLILVFNHSSTTVINQQKPMAAYANDPTVQVAMLVDGPVNAESLHNQVLVTVTNSLTTFKVFQGYDDRIVKEKFFPMTEAGFHVFLRSLEYANFNKGRSSVALSQASGFCPTGNRYVFTYNRNGKQIERYWITNCGSDPYTFTGNSTLTQQLFVNQVPNYDNLITGLNL